MAAKKASRRGRPPLPQDQRRTTTVLVRMTASERSNLERAAARSGQTLSEWIREALNRAATR